MSFTLSRVMKDRNQPTDTARGFREARPRRVVG